jgi:putative Ca2+/H+ antiporter (TMEM165/GDT1 family)
MEPLLTSTAAVALAEIGDKTQGQDVLMVTLGTTAGMMLANIPAVWFGRKIVDLVPLKVVRAIAAALFLGIGLWVMAQAAGWIGG